MQIYSTSGFKDKIKDRSWFESWVSKLESLNGRRYSSHVIQTSLGSTQVYGLNLEDKGADSIVIFPGARTSALFWDIDRGLDQLKGFRIFLVETNGLPNLSDGNTPDIKGAGYGLWAAEVLDQLQIQQTVVAGASFGGLVCMKLAIHAPHRIRMAFLLNPGCLQPFSLSWRNLYYNLLPIFSPSTKNIRKFLDAAVFCKPHHALSAEGEQLLTDYEFFALTRYNDKTQKPYFMNNELNNANVPVYLFEGDRDLLFPFEKSIANARRLLPRLEVVRVFERVGHGIETYAPALSLIRELAI